MVLQRFLYEACFGTDFLDDGGIFYSRSDLRERDKAMSDAGKNARMGAAVEQGMTE